jgi:hypothetical protein
MATFMLVLFLIGQAAGAHNAVACAVCEERSRPIAPAIRRLPGTPDGCTAAIALAFGPLCRRY